MHLLNIFIISLIVRLYIRPTFTRVFDTAVSMFRSPLH